VSPFSFRDHLEIFRRRSRVFMMPVGSCRNSECRRSFFTSFLPIPAPRMPFLVAYRREVQLVLIAWFPRMETISKSSPVVAVPPLFTFPNLRSRVSWPCFLRVFSSCLSSVKRPPIQKIRPRDPSLLSPPPINQKVEVAVTATGLSFPSEVQPRVSSQLSLEIYRIFFRGSAAFPNQVSRPVYPCSLCRSWLHDP